MLITANFRINLPENPAPALVTARDELQKYLSAIFGGAGAGTPAEIILSIDNTMPEEGYRLRAEGQTLSIAGGSPRGTLYGAYALLRDVCGCRFFAADTETVPSMPQMELDDGFELTGKPALEYRDVYWTCAFDPEWSAKNAVNSNSNRFLSEKYGGGITYAMFVHTFENLLPSRKYFSLHPEYYALTGGERKTTQLCLSHPDVLRLVTENVRKVLRERPGCRIISVSQNDCAGYCECDACREADERAGSHMGTLLPFVNAIADAIKDEFPDVAIDTLAYQYTRQAPKDIVPRDNVIIRLCSIECCFSHPLGECEDSGTSWSFSKKQSFRGDLLEWKKISKRLYIWNYTTNFAYYQAPFPNIRTLVPNIRWMYENNVVGLFDEGCYQTPSGEFGELRAYLHGAAMRDPYIDWKEYYNEFLTAYYGGGWKYIDEYINLTSDIAERIHMGIYMHPSTIIPPDAELVKKFDELWDAAEAEAGDERSLAHVRRSRIQVRVYKSICGFSTPEENAALLEDIRAAGITHMREGAPIPAGADPSSPADKWM
jgi:hypothetical protein